MSPSAINQVADYNGDDSVDDDHDGDDDKGDGRLHVTTERDTQERYKVGIKSTSRVHCSLCVVTCNHRERDTQERYKGGIKSTPRVHCSLCVVTCNHTEREI